MDQKNKLKEIILIDEEYFTSLIKDISQAQKTIDLETYIFQEDKIGQKIAEALCHAARRGVKIRILVDGFGTLDWGSTLTHKLENEKILTRVFHPLPWLVWHWWDTSKSTTAIIPKIIFLLSKINSRNHRKICILDNKIVYTGSANITANNLARTSGGDHWRDIGVKLEGIEIEDLQFAFERAWDHKPFHKYVFHIIDDKNEEPVFRLNNTWRRRRILYNTLMTKIAHCTKRIWITNAYFIPDKFLLRRLIRVAKKGVDVRILLPQKSDVFIVKLASYTFYQILLQHGIKIYEYLPGMLHAKALILDDWYCVGSSNINSRSFRYDLEVDVHIRTEAAQEKLARQFLNDIAQSEKIELADLKKQPLIKTIFGKLLLFLIRWM